MIFVEHYWHLIAIQCAQNVFSNNDSEMIKSIFNLIKEKLTFFIIANGKLLSQILLSSPTNSFHGGILSWWKCSANCFDRLFSYDHRDHHNHCNHLDHYHHLKKTELMATWWNFIISETVFIMMRNRIRFSKGADVTSRHI